MKVALPPCTHGDDDSHAGLGPGWCLAGREGQVYVRERDERIAAYRKEHGVTNDVQGVLRKKGITMPQCPRCGGLALWSGDGQKEVMCLHRGQTFPVEACDECGEPGVWICATCGQPGYECERLPDDGLDHSSGWVTCYAHTRKV